MERKNTKKGLKLYHGSPFKFPRFLAPEESGNFRPSEAGRRHHRDVVFMSASIDEALRYAGQGGYLYIVEAEALLYDQAGKKKPRQREGVYVADPKNVKILFRLKLSPRRRGEPQAFELANKEVK